MGNLSKIHHKLKLNPYREYSKKCLGALSFFASLCGGGDLFEEGAYSRGRLIYWPIFFNFLLQNKAYTNSIYA